MILEFNVALETDSRDIRYKDIPDIRRDLCAQLENLLKEADDFVLGDNFSVRVHSVNQVVT